MKLVIENYRKHKTLSYLVWLIGAINDIKSENFKRLNNFMGLETWLLNESSHGVLNDNPAYA